MMRSVSIAAGRLQTSRLGFGTSTLHHLRTSAARASLLSRSHALGVRYFDTAPLYGHMLAERSLGRFVQSRRSDLLLTTKFGIAANLWLSRSPAMLYTGLAVRAAHRRFTGAAPDSLPRDYSARCAERSIEASLANLRTDYVDIFFVHDPLGTAGEIGDDTVRALERIRNSGKARFIGLSGVASACLSVAMRYPGIADVLQIDAGDLMHTDASPQSIDLPPAVTFGHFRSVMQTSATRDCDKILRSGLRTACAINREGVILISTRSEHRLMAALELLPHMDAVASAS